MNVGIAPALPQIIMGGCSELRSQNVSGKGSIRLAFKLLINKGRERLRGRATASQAGCQKTSASLHNWQLLTARFGGWIRLRKLTGVQHPRVPPPRIVPVRFRSPSNPSSPGPNYSKLATLLSGPRRSLSFILLPQHVRSSPMQDKLITLSHPSTGLEDLIQKANDLIRAAKASSTRKAYQSDFRIYDSWCTNRGGRADSSGMRQGGAYIVKERRVFSRWMPDVWRSSQALNGRPRRTRCRARIAL